MKVKSARFAGRVDVENKRGSEGEKKGRRKEREKRGQGRIQGFLT